MINKTITNSVFPDQLKQAQVVALHKKNNALDKSNYRPVDFYLQQLHFQYLLPHL
jgi:hypothetical protein